MKSYQEAYIDDSYKLNCSGHVELAVLCPPTSPSWIHGDRAAQTKSSQKLPLTITGILHLLQASLGLQVRRF